MVRYQGDAIYQKAQRYCSYQERTCKEVREKLRAWGIIQPEIIERILQMLTEQHFLDEQRYVEAFIRGKFVSRRWGKKKLSMALTQKGLAPSVIQQGLDAITPEDYRETLRYVAHRKQQSLLGMPFTQQKRKLRSYLLQKGYETDLIGTVLSEIEIA
jgi:regulatory protein